MKIYLQLIPLFALSLSSALVYGQQPIHRITDEPVRNIYSGLRSASRDTSFKVDLMLSKPIKAFPFSYHFPTIVLNEGSSSSLRSPETSTYHYNMPILRPEKTSKILIAKLDPNFPYSYNMPILKNGAGD